MYTSDKKPKKSESRSIAHHTAQRSDQKNNSISAPVRTSSKILQMERFIGERDRHHMHIDINQPHYKNGNSRRSRIDIGDNQNYRKYQMEMVIDAIKDRTTEPGVTDCINWCKTECRTIISNKGGRAGVGEYD